MTSSWTNEAAIRQRDATATREAMEATSEDGDFAKRHLVNPVLERLLGDVHGRRVLDAGCGNGYFSRMLARRGARVVGVEPTGSMTAFAREREVRERLGITYVRADLARLPEDTGPARGPFDAVVSSMVFMAIPDWRPAMRSCVRALRPGGRFVFAVVHPAFEGLRAEWREHGEYRVRRYLEEYEIPGPVACDFHRPLSAYLNELASLGCRLREVVEPGLDPVVSEGARDAVPGLDGYVHLPNFLVVAADAP
ncbi:class I SAM-dependent methyltransferase [Streptomyces sp. BE147]|uniref:class I SAM-dependent methyltransferase n=1 Tax=Streptomyces sp. BE147 TaxID=3002524 RepID=UPI002E7921BE|nr:class I SAM-dependent methyltransferase [Streptomyces sp. BE147]MEE1737606.1 class I SAM-dependent methyltransferase [Streptomyces sp. BE147]